MNLTKIAAAGAFTFAALTTFASAAEQAAPNQQSVLPQTQVSLTIAQLPAKSTTISDIQPLNRVIPSCTTVGILPAPANGSPEAAPLYQWLIDYDAVGIGCRKSAF